MGYIEALTVMVNTMVCAENNDITAQIEDLTDELTADLYQALVYVADRAGNEEKLCEYCDKRDEYRGSKWRG